jgi:hypothetical protein
MAPFGVVTVGGIKRSAVPNDIAGRFCLPRRLAGIEVEDELSVSGAIGTNRPSGQVADTGQRAVVAAATFQWVTNPKLSIAAALGAAVSAGFRCDLASFSES